MKSIVKYLRQFVPSEMLNDQVKLEDLVKSYQITKDDRIISALFVRLMPSTSVVTAKYFTLEPEYMISYILDLIHNIASDFDFDKNVNFVTYYSRCLERLMYGLLKPFTYKKRVCPTSVCSINEPAYTAGFNAAPEHTEIQDMITDIKHADHMIDFELFESLHNTFDSLTANIFVCLAEGYSRTETAERLSIDIKDVYSAIRTNKSILANLLH